MYLHHTHTFISVNFWIRTNGNRQGGSGSVYGSPSRSLKIAQYGVCVNKTTQTSPFTKTLFLAHRNGQSRDILYPSSFLEEDAGRPAENVGLSIQPTKTIKANIKIKQVGKETVDKVSEKDQWVIKFYVYIGVYKRL
jgi:hypothetical protein